MCYERLHLCPHLVMSNFYFSFFIFAGICSPFNLYISDKQRASIFGHVFLGLLEFLFLWLVLLSLGYLSLYSLFISWAFLGLFSQAQCLINVSGDAVVFVRESDLEVVSTQQPTALCQPLCTGGDVTTWGGKALSQPSGIPASPLLLIVFRHKTELHLR